MICTQKESSRNADRIRPQTNPSEHVIPGSKSSTAAYGGGELGGGEGNLNCLA